MNMVDVETLPCTPYKPLAELSRKVAAEGSVGILTMTLRAEKAKFIEKRDYKPVDEAKAILRHTPKAASILVEKLLASAVANAENNCDINRKLLTVKAALVSPGPIIKRFRPKARGSAGRIRKRTSHFEVILTDNQ